MSQYLEITARVPLPESHREAAALVSAIDKVLTAAEKEINTNVEGLGNLDFEFDARQRRVVPNLHGPRKAKAE